MGDGGGLRRCVKLERIETIERGMIMDRYLGRMLAFRLHTDPRLARVGGIALAAALAASVVAACGSGAGASPTASWPTAEAAAQGLAAKYGYTFSQSTTTDGKPEWSATADGGSLNIILDAQPGQPAELMLLITDSTYVTEAETVLAYFSPAAVTKAQGDITESANDTATVNYSHDVAGGEFKATVAPSIGMISFWLTPTA